MTSKRRVRDREDGQRNSRAAIALTLICLLALLVKVAYLNERQAQPDFTRPTMDERVHDQWAVGLATGVWADDVAQFRDAPYYRAPLYPYTLALLYRLFGHDHAAVILVQLFFGVGSVLLIYYIANQLYGYAGGGGDIPHCRGTHPRLLANHLF